MLFHFGAIVKLNVSVALRGTVLSPAALLLSFIVKVSLGPDWVRRELDNASYSVRLFLFRMSRIAFGPTTATASNQGNDSGAAGRIGRAIMLVRRSMEARPLVQDESSYHLLSMTAL